VSKEIKVALLAIVAIAALIVGYNFLRGSNVFSTDHTYYARYANVDGLTIGSPVNFNGIKVGQVKDMQLLPEDNNKIKVALEVRKDITVGDSTVASLSGSLLGSKNITLFLGKNSKTYEGGEELRSYTVASIADAFQAKALPVLGTVDSTLTRVNTFLSKEAKMSLQGTLVNAQGATEALQNLIIQNQRNINEITTNMARLTRDLSATGKKLDRMVVNFDQMSDSLKSAPIAPALRRLNSTLTEAQGTVAGLNKSLNDKNSSLGKLLNDSSLYKNLDATAAGANALVTDMKANPGRYIHFSVFGKGGDKTKTEVETKSLNGTKTEVKTTNK